MLTETKSLPENLYEIRPTHKARTEEWGFILVTKVKEGTITFKASGGCGRPGTFKTTRSILWAQANWHV